MEKTRHRGNKSRVKELIMGVPKHQRYCFEKGFCSQKPSDQLLKPKSRNLKQDIYLLEKRKPPYESLGPDRYALGQTDYIREVQKFRRAEEKSEARNNRKTVLKDIYQKARLKFSSLEPFGGCQSQTQIAARNKLMANQAFRYRKHFKEGAQLK